MLPDTLQTFIDSVQWTFARTMPLWPHEYIVRKDVDEASFIALVLHIRTHGYKGKFYRRTMTYFEDRGRLYWTMGAPLEETIIINRCKTEDSYEARLRSGTLPAQ